jgi:hypothetical protein
MPVTTLALAFCNLFQSLANPIAEKITIPGTQKENGANSHKD